MPRTGSGKLRRFSFLSQSEKPEDHMSSGFFDVGQDKASLGLRFYPSVSSVASGSSSFLGADEHEEGLIHHSLA